MDTSSLPTPFIRAGEPITAQSLNRLADAARRALLQPGQFQNGAMAVSAFGASASGGTGVPPTYVHIIKSITSFGRRQDAAEVYYFDDDPLVFDWSPLYTNPDAEPEDEDYHIPVKIGIINSGYEPIRASEEIPIGGNGVDIYSITEAEEGDESPEPEESLYRYLILQNVYDLASLTGTELTTIDNEPQGPSKLNGSRNFTNDGGPCETEGA